MSDSKIPPGLTKSPLDQNPPWAGSKTKSPLEPKIKIPPGVQGGGGNSVVRTFQKSIQASSMLAEVQNLCHCVQIY